MGEGGHKTEPEWGWRGGGGKGVGVRGQGKDSGRILLVVPRQTVAVKLKKPVGSKGSSSV